MASLARLDHETRRPVPTAVPVQVLVVLLVALALRSYADGREVVRRAIQATTKLCSSDVMPAGGVVGAGLGQGRGGGGGGGGNRATEKAAAASGVAVPLLHPSQVRGWHIYIFTYLSPPVLAAVF